MAASNDLESDEFRHVDLCIVGAGVAGLNALAVATGYLDAGQRVALVDRRENAGGMWNDTYSYVRLHQPYEFFTAGDIAWQLRRAPEYLATKPEVLGHLRYCRDVLSDRVGLDEYYGWSMVGYDEDSDGVTVQLIGPEGRRQIIRTPRLINAFGFDVTPNKPLALSSSQVNSVSPDSFDFTERRFAESHTPVWIVGGGKTAMDTAALIMARNPGREVNLVAGAGTFFNNREAAFPVGVRRWLAGRTASQVFGKYADMYDGTNDQQVTDAYRRVYGITPMREAERFLNGNLSPSERDAISAGLNSTVMDYLSDVVDRNDLPQLVFRSGEEVPTVPGSWVVNCTGYILRENTTDAPYVSAGGRVVTIHSVTRNHSQSSVGIGCCLAMYNLGLIADEVPLRVFTKCGVDFDRWAPMPRRLAASAQFMLTHRRKREHYRAALDTAAQRLGIRCGPLVGVGATS